MSCPATEPERAPLEPDGRLHEGNRLGHLVADKAEMVCGWLDHIDMSRLPDGLKVAHDEMHEALMAYEENKLAAYERLVGEGEGE